MTPRPTPIPTPSAYVLPAWLADPNTVVFVTIVGGTSDGYPLSFFNAGTGDRLDLSLANVLGYFWTPDGRSFGWLSRDEQTVYLTDLSSGAVTYHTIDEQALRFLLYDWRGTRPLPLVASTSTPEDATFVLLHRNLRHGVTFYSPELSADHRYVAWYDDRCACISAEELSSRTQVQITDPNDNILDRRFGWSPVDHRVAVLQGISDTLPFSLNADRITVYDIATTTAISSYQGPFEYLEWAPDGTRLLFVERTEDYQDRDAPCTLNLTSGERSCLAPLADISPGNAVYTTLYGWTPDGQAITYVHCDLGWPQQGGFCLFAPLDDTVFCPTEGLPNMEARAARGYSLSPNGEYVAILTDDMCPTDDSGRQGAFVMGLDGSGYLSLWQPKPEVIDFAQPFYDILWRPIPKP